MNLSRISKATAGAEASALPQQDAIAKLPERWRAAIAYSSDKGYAKALESCAWELEKLVAEASARPPQDLADELERIIGVIDRNLNYRMGQRPLGWRDLIAFAAKLRGEASARPSPPQQDGEPSV